MLESHLNLVKIQLQTLNAARERLTAVFHERARVIDLLCYAAPCTGNHSTIVRQGVDISIIVCLFVCALVITELLSQLTVLFL